MPAEIRQFLIGSDNFGVLRMTRRLGQPPRSMPARKPRSWTCWPRTGWRLTDILVTHHHGDHVAAVPGSRPGMERGSFGPQADAYRVPEIDEGVREGDRVRVGGLEAIVIDTPGHTVGHIAYYFAAEKLLFSGDTMFSLGCGRLFEGTPAQMWSLCRSWRPCPTTHASIVGMSTPCPTRGSPAASTPRTPALKARVQEVEQLRAAGAFTLPTMIGIEKATNPFLRAADPRSPGNSEWKVPRLWRSSLNCANGRTAPEASP